MKKIAVIILILGALVVSANDNTPKVADYQLDVVFEPEQAAMQGTAVVIFEEPIAPETTFSFYLHGELNASKVLAGSAELKITQAPILFDLSYSLLATKVTVEAGDTALDKIQIIYSGWFNPSKARSLSDYMRIDKTGVYLRAMYYSLWFPLFEGDDGQDYETSFSSVRITTPEAFKPVFTGTRVDEEVANGLRISHWKAEDLPLFAAQVTARPYEVTSSGQAYVYHLQNDASRKTASDSLAIVNKIVDLYRAHYKSSAKAGQTYLMEMPRFGDIASGNVVGVLGEFWQGEGDASRFYRILAHELVHSFVQINLPRTHTLYALAIEGFPAYFHLPVLAEIFGEEWYQEYMKRVETSYLERRKTGTTRRGNPLPVAKPIDKITDDEIGIYKDTYVLGDRALLFFNYLRQKMGAETFYKFAAELVSRKDLSVADIADLSEAYLKDSADEVVIWLSTNDLPDGLLLYN